MKKYIIDEKRLRELLFAEDELNALEAAGVDNWGDYGMEQKLLFETQEDVEEEKKALEVNNFNYIDPDDLYTIEEALENFKEYKESEK